MTRGFIASAVLLAATAVLTLNAADAFAGHGRGHGGQGGGNLPAAASPYAILEPQTVAPAGGGEGRAAYTDGMQNGRSNLRPDPSDRLRCNAEACQ
jgi:hypothetical protein